jgi:formamidopyrimidine-DNA glycosylase
MPELPEVATIIRRLRDGTPDHRPLPGQTIQAVKITWDRIIAHPSPALFTENLVGKTIIDARRRGKYLHFPLSEGHLIAHLRMSGDMRMEKHTTAQGDPIPPQAYDRVIFTIEPPWRLVFSNIRKFGRMWFTNDPQSVFGGLGPEPLSEGLSAAKFFTLLQAHKRQIKPLLMDQNFIAGLGNIYTDESLFRAKLHPLRKSDSLSKAESQRLYHAIRAVLKEGIQEFGASLDWIYRGGQFQNTFRVYQQTGKPCPNCNTPIEKLTVGQRGTHICPACQAAPPSA